NDMLYKPDLIDILYFNNKAKMNNKYGYTYPNHGESMIQPVTFSLYENGKNFSYVPYNYNGRYCGLNLHTWFFRRTIEFRYFENSSVYENIQKFYLVNNIISFALNESIGKLTSLFNEYINNISNFSIDSLKFILS